MMHAQNTSKRICNSSRLVQQCIRKYSHHVTSDKPYSPYNSCSSPLDAVGSITLCKLAISLAAVLMSRQASQPCALRQPLEQSPVQAKPDIEACICNWWAPAFE